MEGFLALGFLIGMQHALEADHLAAVGALVDGQSGSRGRLVLRGAAWGLGHTITLFAICSAVILLGVNISTRLSTALEFSVGVMLFVLGIDVLRRMRKKRIHFHVHAHKDKKPHVHAHSHGRSVQPHSEDPHVHQHVKGFPKKALLIGLMHGGAGSAGLLALAVAATQQVSMALGYVFLFGIGSLVGMTTLTMIVSWPLGIVERNVTWIYQGITYGAGIFAIGLGIVVMIDNATFLSSVN